MKKVTALIAFVGVLAVAACGSTGGGEGGGDGCGGGGTDMTQTMIDNTNQAMYMVAIHDEVEAGQYWETSYTIEGAGTTTNRWQVAKVDGDTAIVEQLNKNEGPYSHYEYVIAYEVDLTVDGAGEPNVLNAWIGAPGEAPTQIEVMDVPESDCGGEGGDVEMTEEDFETELAGGNWSGTLRTVGSGDAQSKQWVADNGWFGGMIKMETSSFTQELTAFGTDAEPLLAWE